MAKTKVLSLLLLALLAISMLSIQVLAAGYGPGSVPYYQCPVQCVRRCSKAQYPKPCMIFCQKCCQKCSCVPPGFSGNKQVCPCYDNPMCP